MIKFTLKMTKKTPFLSIFTSIMLIIGILSISSCKKNDAINASEQTQMTDFAKSHSITTTADASGLLYQIITPGNTTKPILSNTVTVTYVGTLMNGSQFDAGTATFPLSNLIQGWQIGIPKIGVGGEIKLLIPSSLGYGTQGAGSSIPGNSPLYFDIKLSAVK